MMDPGEVQHAELNEKLGSAMSDAAEKLRPYAQPGGKGNKTFHRRGTFHTIAAGISHGGGQTVSNPLQSASSSNSQVPGARKSPAQAR